MVNLIKIGNQFATINHKEYLINGSSDFSSLPTDCDPGSVAYTPDMNLMYQFGNDNQWHKIGG